MRKRAAGETFEVGTGLATRSSQTSFRRDFPDSLSALVTKRYGV
jgi:hypothetical protein